MATGRAHVNERQARDAARPSDERDGIVAANRSYESWVAQHTSLIAADLKEKHRLLAESAFVFLRGTFYRWAQTGRRCVRRSPTPPPCSPSATCTSRTSAPGVMPKDAWSGASTTSTRRHAAIYQRPGAPRHERGPGRSGQALDLSVRRACRSILDGYAASLERGGRPVVLAERHDWLRQIATQELKNPARFWGKIATNPRATAVPASVLRLMALPADSSGIRFFRRRAGVGSLGRPRLVAQAIYDGGLIAREAKALVPSAVDWARGSRHATSHAVELTGKAVGAADPFFVGDAHWTVRRLSPDCLKIELCQRPRRRDDAKLLRAMGWETANVHLGTAGAAVNKDLAGRSDRWLERATAAMVSAVVSDYRAWRKQQRRSR